ncbi:MAG: DUF1223 domain-containing protein [Bradyrhizobium sp.]
MRSSIILILGALAAARPHAAVAADRPVVVELFTSQGCSSCPPANAYLNELSKQRPDILALAFHVTYWDYLGWKDPFSLQIATERQARYGQRFGDGSYTPEIVVDGGTGLVGSDREAVEKVIAKARARNATAADVRVAAKDGKVSIDIGPGRGSAKIYLIGYDREHITAVGRGENRGRTMPESNIVRSFRSVGDWLGGAVHFDQPHPDSEEVAVILESQDGRIVGAASSR